MDYKIVFTESVNQDIESIAIWYKEINPKLANKFRRDLFNVYDYIGKNPFQFQIRFGETRISFLKKFPFGIHYNIEKEIIYINAIFHTSQNSENWTIK